MSQRIYADRQEHLWPLKRTGREHLQHCCLQTILFLPHKLTRGLNPFSRIPPHLFLVMPFLPNSTKTPTPTICFFSFRQATLILFCFLTSGLEKFKLGGRFCFHFSLSLELAVDYPNFYRLFTSERPLSAFSAMCFKTLETVATIYHSDLPDQTYLIKLSMPFFPDHACYLSLVRILRTNQAGSLIQLAGDRQFLAA